MQGLNLDQVTNWAQPWYFPLESSGDKVAGQPRSEDSERGRALPGHWGPSSSKNLGIACYHLLNNLEEAQSGTPSNI